MIAGLHRLLARVRAHFTRRSQDDDFAAEAASHLAMLEDENIRRGMSPERAAREARVAFGAESQLRESHREQRSLPFLETTWRDLRYAVRTLRRETGFALFTIAIVGLGIGASSTVFSVLNTVLLRDLPFDEPDRLVWMATLADDGVSEWRIQVDHVLDLRRQSSSFTDLAGYYAYFGTGDRVLTGVDMPERLTTVPVTENFFPLLGVKPHIGRLFTAEECRINGPAVVLLSYGFWVRRYGGDPSVVGRSIQLNDRSVLVSGVLPAWFDFGTIFSPGTRVDLFAPFPMSPETNRQGNTLGVIARLKPGASMESARAETVILARQLVEHNPGRNGLRPILRTLKEQVSGRFRLALLVLTGAVAMVMLIVCANLSNLQLARMASRQKEIAIRAALGAGRARLIRQMTTESLALSACGAAVGLLTAFAATRVLASLQTFNVPLLASVRLDPAVLAFTVALAVVTGLIFGLMPALQLRRVRVHDALKESARSMTASGSQNSLRNLLVVSEIAVACVLLVVSGLFIRSLLAALDVDLGFRPQNVAALRVDPGRQYRTTEQRNVYYTEVLDRVRRMTGVAEASLAGGLPLDGGGASWAIRGKGQTYPEGKYPEGFVRAVTEGYFRTAGITLVAGRDFTEWDRETSEPVVIVNETLARTLWPGQNPLGQLMHSQGIFNTTPPRRVIGVVADVRHRAIEQGAGCELYLPLRQGAFFGQVQLVVRTQLPLTAQAPSVYRELKTVQPNLAANEWRLLDDLVEKAVSPRRFTSTLLAGFSFFALVLAALGIYAVIAYSVTQRRKEFGIRMAIGASGGELRRQILKQTLRLSLLGTAIGAALSWAIARGLTGMLFGVGSRDPVAFGATVASLTLVALAAGYMPARRASRVDPMIALRAD